MDPQILWAAGFVAFTGTVVFIADYTVTTTLNRFNAWLDRR